MATQVDSLSRGSFESFRPWLRRDPAVHSAVQEVEGDASATTQLVNYGLVKNQPSFCTQSSQDLRAHLLVSSTASPASTPPLTPGTPRNDGPNQVCSSSAATAPTQPKPDMEQTQTSGSEPPTLVGSVTFTASRDVAASSSPSETLHFRELEKVLPQRAKQSLKRRRALSDVDGPNTAALCSKKRRLQRFLITSRLSQPFSQPATHIINRESVASGDKRFLKLAAIMNARRIIRLSPAPPQFTTLQGSSLSGTGTSSANTNTTIARQPTQTWVPVPHPPSQCELLRRAAMANQLRKRMYAEAASGHITTTVPLQLKTNPRFSMGPMTAAAPAAADSTAAAAVAVTAGFTGGLRPAFKLLRPATGGAEAAAGQPAVFVTRQLYTGPKAAPPQAPAHLPQALPPQTLGRMAASGLVRSSLPPAVGGTAGPQQLARPLLRSSPRLRPARDRIPVPEVQLPPPTASASPAEGSTTTAAENTSYYEEDDCAFPTSEYESRYEANDDSEDVYSDFSVLFSGAGEDTDWSEEGFDDYMDELDGIAHLPR